MFDGDLGGATISQNSSRSINIGTSFFESSAAAAAAAVVVVAVVRDFVADVFDVDFEVAVCSDDDVVVVDVLDLANVPANDSAKEHVHPVPSGSQFSVQHHHVP